MNVQAVSNVVLGSREFARIATAIRQDAGITLSDAKLSLVHSRLAKRLRMLKMTSFEEYCDLIESQEGAVERGQMLSALTTNVTRFYREKHHFDLLEKMLDELRSKSKKEGVRIWSAACSTGQEPYSIALLLHANGFDPARDNIRILATDIDPNVLSIARSGVFAADMIEDIPQGYRKGVEKIDEGDRDAIRISDQVKSFVTFNMLNLTKQWPIKTRFDIIFCRNVVIYFDVATQEALWERLGAALKPQGWMFVGHSERVSGKAAESFRSEGFTAYRKLSVAGKS